MAENGNWWADAPVVNEAPRSRGAVEFDAPVAPTKAEKPTEAQQKTLTLLTRIAGGASDIQKTLALDPEAQKAGLFETLSRTALGEGVITREIAGAERRRITDAQSDMLDAILTLGTGAAYNEEQKIANRVAYFPQYGDTKEEVAAKNDRLKRLIEAARIQAGPLAEEFDKSIKPLFGEITPPRSEKKSPPEAVISEPVIPIKEGELIQSEADLAAQRQLQAAEDRGASVDEMVALADQLGRQFTPENIQAMRDARAAGRKLQHYSTPSGQATAAQETIGGFLATPVGETIGGYTGGAANALTFGMLDELAPILGLDPTRVQAAKDYLRTKAPVASFGGELTGAVLGTVPVIKGAQALTAGTRLAGAAPLIGEIGYGAAYGAGEAEEGQRALGALIGGGAAGVGGALINRFLPGGPGTFTGAPRAMPEVPPAGGPAVPPIGPASGGATVPPTTPPAGGPRGSVGAMSVAEETIRAQRAAQLPVPIELARFQRTRDFVEQQRARELAKNNEVGGPIRDRMAQQQEALRQNFESFIEGTGSQVWENPYEQGGVIANALGTLAKRERTKIKALYNRADAAGETAEPVSYQDVIAFVNEQTPTTRERLAPVLKVVQEEIAKNDPTGSGTITLKQMEDVRKLINKVAQPGTPDAAFGKQLKDIIDGSTENAGGDIYRQARAARAKYAQDFENIDLVQKVFANKPGTVERYVALEKVTDLISGSNTPLDSVNHLLGLLDRAGPRGERAKRELQGAVMEKIRDQAYRGITRDESGATVIQPAALNKIITDLDRSKKLDAIFDKKTVELLRTVNDVTKDIVTAPPGSVNVSGTSSAIMNAIDTVATFGTTGIPIPAARILAELRKAMATRQLRKEVKRLLD